MLLLKNPKYLDILIVVIDLGFKDPARTLRIQPLNIPACYVQEHVHRKAPVLVTSTRVVGAIFLHFCLTKYVHCTVPRQPVPYQVPRLGWLDVTPGGPLAI